ncbi:hypothetical protein GH714_035538 [Hevea brasiliensis]|uniref:Pentacotripeptide-repeat region of PRORP domain-containing protein n=1 Tax=Hevea brasiliensis TaxID=3981 RepID=A0A6A6KRY8_HEVBR|nr:hypothetical protein GH714_035538 [Hevea brasiliensis]
MVVGLCKVNKVDISLSYLREMRSNGVVPSAECYEELIKLLCSNEQYEMAVNLIIDLEIAGRHVTSFIGNVLLLHSLRSGKLYDAWVRVREMQDVISPILLVLGQLTGIFSRRVQLIEEINNLEEVIEQCFPLDLFTYNILLRRLSISKMDDALELFDRLCQKGYEPNQWTYDILVHGLFKHGRKDEARKWVDEMFRKGFDPTHCTYQLLNVLLFYCDTFGSTMFALCLAVAYPNSCLSAMVPL